MTQADRVHSTPPTNTSPTRRNVLGTIAAAAAATTIAAKPAAAVGPIPADPIYAAIDAFRQADAARVHVVKTGAVFPAVVLTRADGTDLRSLFAEHMMAPIPHAELRACAEPNPESSRTRGSVRHRHFTVEEDGWLSRQGAALDPPVAILTARRKSAEGVTADAAARACVASFENQLAVTLFGQVVPAGAVGTGHGVDGVVTSLR
jgi:hypothetical protein